MLRQIATAGVVGLAIYLYISNKPMSPLNDDVKWEEPRNWSGSTKSSSDTSLLPFKVSVSDSVLEDLKERLDRYRAPESMEFDGAGFDSEYGLDPAYLATVVEYWRSKYHWRTHESRLNSLPQFTTTIDGISVHFIHAKGVPSKPTVLFLHGWPGSVLEFYNVLPRMIEKGYTVIAPSLPGYGFSSAPRKAGFSVLEAAVVMLKLMSRIHGDTLPYVVQGGDWGAMIAQAMAQLAPLRIAGLHLNMFPAHPHMLKAPFQLALAAPAERAKVWPLSSWFLEIIKQTGYMHEQATKPHTLAAGLSDSPAGLAAWIIEKFLAWSDNAGLARLEETISMDDMLTNVMIYWTTNSISSSMRFYKESFTSPAYLDSLFARPVHVPVALAAFPRELLPSPRPFLSNRYTHIVQYEDMPRGGHFAALEQPQLLLDDLCRFLGRFDSKMNLKG